MSDTPPTTSSADDLPVESENKLTSEQFDEFNEALEVLYIIGNLSGRVQFAQAWPEPAKHVLGAELIQCDVEGTQDRDHRLELEKEAEERRLELLEFMDSVEDKSVEEGALQIDYVSGAIAKMGRPMALLIYGQKIVDRFAPPTAEELAAAAEQEKSEEQSETSPEDSSSEDASAEAGHPQEPDQVPTPSPVVEPIMQEPSAPPPPPGVDSLETVKPIDMSPPVAAPSPPAPEQPVQEAQVQSLKTPIADEIRPIDTPAPIEQAPPALVEPPPLAPVEQPPVTPIEQAPPAPVEPPPRTPVEQPPMQPEQQPPAMPVEQQAQSAPPAPVDPAQDPSKQASGTIQFVSSKKDPKDEGEGTPPEGAA